MSQEFGTEFTNSYSQLLIKVWTDEAEAARLAADPTGYAREKGLPVAEGSIVRVDSTPREELLAKEEIITAWTATPGVHTLLVPATPIVNVDELEDAELEALSAGLADNNNNVVIVAA